jgi:two-component system sensor histidine kinase ComP
VPQQQSLLDNIDAAIWTVDKVTDKRVVSSGIHRVYGYSREEFKHNQNLWKDVIYAEDISHTNEYLEKLDSGQSVTFEHRIVHKSSEIRWVQCIGTPVLDGNGSVARINGVVIDINDRKIAQQELERNQKLLQNVLDSVDVGIWSYDGASRTLPFASAGLSKITGYPTEKFVDRESWKSIIHPNDLSIFEQLSKRLLQGNSDISEYRIIGQNGDIRWVQNRIITTMDRSGILARLDGVVFDITSRKLMEEALHISEQRYKSIFEYNSDIICEVDLSGNIHAINPAAEHITGELIMDKDLDLSLTQLFGADNLQRMAGYFEKVKQGQPQNYEMTSRHSNGKVFHWEMKKIPIYVNLEVVGAYAICKDVTAKKETEKALADREAQYRLIADNMMDVMGVLEIEGAIRYCSPSYTRMLGFNEGTMVGTSIFQYVHQEDLNIINSDLEDLVQQGIDKQFQFRFIHRLGYSIEVECVATPVFNKDGQVDSIVVVSRDITEKAKIEKELKESEARYRRLIDLSPQPIATQRDGKFLYMNPAGVNLLGASSEDELIGTSVFDIVSPEYIEVARNRSALVIEDKYVSSMEYKMIRLDGHIIEAETTSIYDVKSQSTLVVFNDITERRKAERALQESEERYRRLVELSPIAIAISEDKHFIYANPAAINIIGAKHSDEIIGINPLDWIHPDDRVYVEERVENTMKNGYSTPGEFRIIRLDGKEAEVSVTSIYDSKSLTVQHVFEDITSRKQAERALLESEELNRRLVELSPEPIVLHADYKFIYINPAGLTLFQFPNQDDIIGKPIFDYIHPDYRAKVESRISDIYKQMAISPFVEQKIIRMDGKAIDVEVIAAAIPYKGTNAGITLLRDITDRMKAEDDRTRAEQLIRDSENRYIRLQTSLDQFSHDLFGVMKLSEIEQRLVKEVQKVINVAEVYLIEVDRECNVVIKAGNVHIPKQLLEEMFELRNIPICELNATPSGYFLKIGEIREKNYLLCIGEKPPMLMIRAKKIWLNTIARYVSVLYDNFLLIEDLTKELEKIASNQVAPPWLLRLLFNLSEHERKRLSQDLHDDALQEQIIWYRKLDQLSTDPSVSPELREQLQQISQGLLDVIYQIRITCNELRPPMLKEEGLVSSLEALFEFTQLRTNYSIEFDATNFNNNLSAEFLLGFYRIVQEMLANATKHSNATRVQFSLFSYPDRIQLIYVDNGRGMDVSAMENSFSSMGVYGMKERVRSMDGKMEVDSLPDNGLSIFISVPTL